jgi:pyruvate/2-oxoglutarate dehydrogenase complex dihydrolipoamide acyltransferase (E2) component
VGNIQLAGPASESSFRRMAMGAWDRPGDPTIYGFLDIDTSAGQRRVDELRAQGESVTWTHMVARAAALTLRRYPDANVVPRMGRIYRRAHVDVFLQVAVPRGDGDVGTADLSGVKIEQAERKALSVFAAELRERAERVRRHEDPELERSKRGLSRVPRLLMRPVLRFLTMLQMQLNMDLRFAGLPRDPFGSIAVTSIGMMGIDTGLAPLFPIGGPPIVLLVGAVTPRAVVDAEGQVVARPILRLGGTFDHRCFDGFQIAHFTRELKRLLELDVDAL